MKPAHVRAKAPVARFAVLLSLGRELECSPSIAASPRCAASKLARRRSAFKLEKYIAEPHPVRKVLGNVPLQNCFMGFGPFAIDRIVPDSVLERDCWTRVFKRSAGWRRTAERTPELRPAKKWTIKNCQFVLEGCWSEIGTELKLTSSNGEQSDLQEDDARFFPPSVISVP